MTQDPDLAALFDEWIVRLESTYNAVGYTCGHRLGDRAVGDRVAATVIRRLLERPNVFRYSGLPYSGRIASIAEPLISGAEDIGSPVTWNEIRAHLEGLTPERRRLLVGVFVLGESDDRLADWLGCPAIDVATGQHEVREYLRQIPSAVPMPAVRTRNEL